MQPSLIKTSWEIQQPFGLRVKLSDIQAESGCEYITLGCVDCQVNTRQLQLYSFFFLKKKSIFRGLVS